MAVKQNNTEASTSTAQNSNSSNNESKLYDLSLIIELIDLLVSKQQQNGKLSDISNTAAILVQRLAYIEVPRDSQDLMQFNKYMIKIGEFLVKASEEEHTEVYFGYLRTVYHIITGPGTETPSAAISIVFQIFPENLITKAVSQMLSTSDPTTDEAIRKTLKVLCLWLRTSLICQNLNLWILSILTGLKKQQKYVFIEEIAMDIIEPLFIAINVPVLRPKVAPVVFHILQTVQHTPFVFHKIVRRVPHVIKQLKTDITASEETKKILQNMVDLLSALMYQFQGYDPLYKPIREALAEFTPSFHFRSVLDFPNCFDNDDTEVIRTNSKVGLVNLGNTCYMNSVLQALSMTKEFSRDILLTKNKSPVLLKIQQLLAMLIYSVRPEITPSIVLHATRPPGFTPGFQQDSSEFLGYLLEMIHDQEKNSLKIDLQKGSPNSNSNNSENSSSKPYEDEESENEGASATNFKNPTNIPFPKAEMVVKTTIEKTIAGKITTTYKCLTCSWASKNTDTFRDLQLAFPELKTDCASNYSVQDLLDYYCSPEKLDGDNQYFCEKCKRLSDAQRYINVVDAPKNLILTLKHFKYDQKYHMRAKLMHKVFHDESVSLKIHSEDSLEEISCVHYNLYAAVVHSGFSMDSGHYYTFASENSDDWYKFNDNIVTKSSISELHNLHPPNTPYILFYQMKSKSNENATLENKIEQIEVPDLPTLEVLPIQLRDFITRDNHLYMKEKRLRKLNSSELRTVLKTKDKSNDDDEPPSACGGNALNYVNRFIC